MLAMIATDCVTIMPLQRLYSAQNVWLCAICPTDGMAQAAASTTAYSVYGNMRNIGLCRPDRDWGQFSASLTIGSAPRMAPIASPPRHRSRPDFLGLVSLLPRSGAGVRRMGVALRIASHASTSARSQTTHRGVSAKRRGNCPLCSISKIVLSASGTI